MTTTKFMNDPQPAFYSNGRWTMYALTNEDYPTGNGTDWQAWTSTDLENWTFEGTAIHKYQDGCGDPWSGTVIADTQNTAGFGSDAILALTTVSGKPEEGQSTALWVSKDGGKSFSFDKIVMPNPMNRSDSSGNATAFRDPRVVWMEDTKTWIMTIAENHKISFYSSKNLQNWQYQSGFTSDTLSTLGTIECPSLFSINLQDAAGNVIGSKWILLCSGNGYETGFTSGAHYWSGDIVNGHFIPDDPRGSWLDAGSDFYAASVYSSHTISSTPQNAYYATAWKNNWSYANKVTGAGYYGDVTRTRVLTFRQTDQGDKLYNDLLWKGKPFAFNQVFGTQIYDRPLTVSTPQILNRVDTPSSLFFAAFSKMNGSWPDTITITLQSGAGTPITIVLSPNQNNVDLQRTNSGYTPDESKEWSSNRNGYLAFGERFTMFALINKSGIELVFNDGALSMTSLVFPSSVASTPEITVSNGMVNIDHFGVGPLAGDQTVLSMENDSCFLAGTLIETETGEILVETLAVGMRVIAHENGVRVSRPVVRVDTGYVRVLSAERDPERAGLPVRIVAGALGTVLGKSAPHTDLLVTPEHGIFLDGALLPARMLVNGSSIRYERAITEYDHYHFALDRLSVVRASGALAESYRDHRVPATSDVVPDARGNRAFAEKLYRKLCARSGPRSVDRPQEILLSRNANLRVLTADGRQISCLRQRGNHALFRIPVRSKRLYIVSNADRPDRAVGPFVDDRRMLGVLVGAVNIWNPDGMVAITDHLRAPNLPGWHGLDAPNMRWTNGNACLPLDEHIEEDALLSIEILDTASYLTSASA